MITFSATHLLGDRSFEEEHALVQDSAHAMSLLKVFEKHMGDLFPDYAVSQIRYTATVLLAFVISGKMQMSEEELALEIQYTNLKLSQYEKIS